MCQCFVHFEILNGLFPIDRYLNSTTIHRIPLLANVFNWVCDHFRSDPHSRVYKAQCHGNRSDWWKESECQRPVRCSHSHHRSTISLTEAHLQRSDVGCRSSQPLIDYSLVCVLQTLLSFVIAGKSLKDMEESLSTYGIKEGCKLMMIGKRVRLIDIMH